MTRDPSKSRVEHRVLLGQCLARNQERNAHRFFTSVSRSYGRQPAASWRKAVRVSSADQLLSELSLIIGSNNYCFLL
jgi:hypothetical protein